MSYAKRKVEYIVMYGRKLKYRGAPENPTQALWVEPVATAVWKDTGEPGEIRTLGEATRECWSGIIAKRILMSIMR